MNTYKKATNQIENSPGGPWDPPKTLHAGPHPGTPPHGTPPQGHLPRAKFWERAQGPPELFFYNLVLVLWRHAF